MAWSRIVRGVSAAPHGAKGDAPPDSIGDSTWPNSLPPPPPPDDSQRALLQTLRSGAMGVDKLPLAVRFGEAAVMQFHFAQGHVLADPEAWRALRLNRALPQPAEGAEPGVRASWRELDLTLWDLGIAAGSHASIALLDEPADAWHQRLLPVHLQSLPRYSAVPAHLEMSRHLTSHGAATPAELARRCHLRANEVRRFVQACLSLSLLHWMPSETLEF